MAKIKAYTLSEVLVTIGILGVLAAMIIPAVTKTKPDVNKVMFKKAYSSIEKTVADMIGDSIAYPSTDTTGFANADTSGITGFPASTDKFCYLFSQRMNTVNTVNCPSTGGPGTFTTTDGIVWTFTVPSTFTVGASNYYNIKIDVNGTKAPNCGDTANSSGYTACTGNQTADKFYVGVRYDGKINVIDTNAIPILTNPTKSN